MSLEGLDRRRDVVMPRFRTKHNFVVQADYSQLEVRIVALLSQDDVLLDWFRRGVDVHTHTAKIIFDLTDEQWADIMRKDPDHGKRMRTMAKKGRHAANYGVEAGTLWKQLLPEWEGLPYQAVTRFLKGFHQLHRRLGIYQKAQYEKARKHGYVEMPVSGRRFHFHGNVEPAKVYNLPPQGTAADIINLAIEGLFEDMQIDEWTGTNDHHESIIAQVHDALVLQGPDPFRLKSLLHKHMEQDVTIGEHTLKFPIDVEVGWDWNNLSDKPKDVGLHPALGGFYWKDGYALDAYGKRVFELLHARYGRESFEVVT